MPTPPRFCVALLALASILSAGPIACASAGATPGLAQTGRQSDVITQRELSDIALADKTVLEAIQRLRPRFLDSRSSTVREGKTPILMSLDGSNPQDASELARISVAEVAEIRLLSVGDAALRFGMNGSNAPVILVTRKHP